MYLSNGKQNYTNNANIGVVTSLSIVVDVGIVPSKVCSNWLDVKLVSSSHSLLHTNNGNSRD